jgi:hypothetical protein
VNFDKEVKLSPELIICMGDTIAHLTSQDDLDILFKKTFQKLEVSGKLILSFRDYTKTLEGDNRFIPVKSDENKILTCFIEYFSDYVIVTDLLHENLNGKWFQKISSYKKLRLSPDGVINSLTKCGFMIDSTQNIYRMTHIIALKPKI